VTPGVGTYHAHDLSVRTWDESEDVVVGKYCSIADQVTLFCGGAHRTSLVSTWPFDIRLRASSEHGSRTYKKQAPTHIGNDVWIAFGATVMAGLTIGNGAVIGPCAVVFDDVAPYAVVRGNPAVEIRRRFDERTIARLQAIAWWDWPEAVISERHDDFFLSVDEFVRKYQ